MPFTPAHELNKHRPCPRCGKSVLLSARIDHGCVFCLIINDEPFLYDSTTREIDKEKYKYKYFRGSLELSCLKCKHEWSISEYEPLDGCPACELHTDKVEGDGTFFLGGKL